MEFPNQKLSRDEMKELDGFYYPPKPKLWQDLMSPWPLKLGKPTTSVIALHNRGCAAWGNKNYQNDPCTCPRWKAYLKSELKKSN